MPPSVDLEDLISHSDSQARHGLVARHLLHTHLAAMPSGQGPRDAHLTLYQRIFSHQLMINMASDPGHSTTYALLQLTTDIETSLNHLTVPCVAIDLTSAFDTVSHDTLISKIAGSSLPPAITRWLSCYPRGKQAASSFRGIKSSTRIVRTSVLQVVTFMVQLLHS